MRLCGMRVGGGRVLLVLVVWGMILWVLFGLGRDLFRRLGRRGLSGLRGRRKW